MSDIINIHSQETWPRDILEFLEHNQEVFVGWHCSCCNYSYTQEYDQVINRFREILRNYSLIGYHCTKLCSHEVEEILRNGMSLQDLRTLFERVDKLKEINLISNTIASELKARNQANEEYRANMLWFCFYKPSIAGRSGIYRFFDSWGGEALYNSHEDDPVTGKILRSIGTPCLVKAKVSIRKLIDSYTPTANLMRVFLKTNGHILDHPTELEGFSIENLSPDNIINIFKYPSEEFVELTKCDEWYSSIALT